jgi:UDP-2,4-diacetamido-2,4,6-trideoxy-beta-L-altropyranose hydrolase
MKNVTKRDKKILFRADSSSEIGIGHIMRDLVLAKQFEDAKIIFACRDLDGHIMDKIPYPIKILGTDLIDELIEVIKQESIDMVVIDNYEIDYEDEKEIKDKTGVKIFVFDGSYKKHYCDFLLNQNIYADKNQYQNLVPSFCKLFVGLKYALIRDEFRQKKKIIKNNTDKIKVLLTLGGADYDNITLEILKKLDRIHSEKFEIIIVIGTANIHKNIIKDFLKLFNHSAKLIVDAKNMAELMNEVDFAISSAGSTVIELLYMRVPFFSLSIAPNQNMNLKYLIEHNLAYNFDLFEENLKILKAIDFKQDKSIKIATKSVAKEIS